jgi:hypothetical protein
MKHRLITFILLSHVGWAPPTNNLISHSCEGPALSEAEWAGIQPFRHSECNEESVFHHPASKARFVEKLGVACYC